MGRVVFPIPNIEVRYSTIETPTPFAWMRGVGHTQNAWMNHGFMSELAELAGMDTLSFQLRLLDAEKVSKDRADYDDAVARVKRCRRLIEMVAAIAGPSLDRTSGRGRGIAVFDMSYLPGFHSSCIALSVDIWLDGKGGITVEKVIACVDCGLAVNPELVEAQIQGGIMFGISNALYGKITLKSGRVEQSNFHDYRILRLKDSPHVEVHVLPSGDHPSGVGEGAVPVVIGALVDAIFAAGGPRIRALPIMDTKLGPVANS
jgi:isoquinoline 1-oxidoreductase beta subunit